MFDDLTERMLHAYFLADVAIGRFVADPRALFSAYARIFLLTEEEEERLFALTRREELLSLGSEQQYLQYRRLRQYFASRGGEKTDEMSEPADLKGNALSQAEKFQLKTAEATRIAACENLISAAESGIVACLSLLGILRMEGLVVGRDGERGLQDLRRAADWNSEEGLFAALRYDEENREKYLVRLEDLLSRGGQAKAAERVKERYGVADPVKYREFLLLEKAFGQGVVKRDLYSKAYARLIYSEALSEKDKEAVVLSPDKELFAEASTLPLKLSAQHGTFDPAPLFNGQPSEEVQKIVARLENIDLRGLDSYMPLCLVGESAYVAKMYLEAIERGFPDAHIEKIMISDLTEYDIEPTKSHIFVRSCAEDSFNVFFLLFRGEIRERVFEAAKNFLKSAKRRRFHLIRPGVALDLSSVLPVCFCDGEWAKRLEELTYIVRIPPLTAEEKGAFPQKILAEKCALYRAEPLAFAEGLSEKLAEYAADDLEKILDAAVLEHRRGEYELTAEDVKTYYKRICEKSNTYYGFGGNDNGYRE